MMMMRSKPHTHTHGPGLRSQLSALPPPPPPHTPQNCQSTVKGGKTAGLTPPPPCAVVWGSSHQKSDCLAHGDKGHRVVVVVMTFLITANVLYLDSNILTNPCPETAHLVWGSTWWLPPPSLVFSSSLCLSVCVWVCVFCRQKLDTKHIPILLYPKRLLSLEYGSKLLHMSACRPGHKVCLLVEHGVIMWSFLLQSCHFDLFLSVVFKLWWV